MFSGEDDAVVADPQPAVVAASQCGDLPGKGCGVLSILLYLGDDPLSVPYSEAAHVPDGSCPPFDLQSLIHAIIFSNREQLVKGELT